LIYINAKKLLGLYPVSPFALSTLAFPMSAPAILEPRDHSRNRNDRLLFGNLHTNLEPDRFLSAFLFLSTSLPHFYRLAGKCIPWLTAFFPTLLLIVLYLVTRKLRSSTKSVEVTHRAMAEAKNLPLREDTEK
jgi:hypothetical protein